MAHDLHVEEEGMHLHISIEIENGNLELQSLVLRFESRSSEISNLKFGILKFEIQS